MTVTASVEIDAPPAAVWETLTAFERYGAWNPLLPRVRGEIAEGAEIRAVVAQPRVPPLPIRARITRVEPERELTWETRVPGAGLLSVAHTFELTPLAGADGGSETEAAERTRFTQIETLDGPVGRAVPDRVVGFLADGFDEMNAALRRRVESTLTPSSF